MQQDLDKARVAISDNFWFELFKNIYENGYSTNNEYFECTSVSFTFDPIKHCIMTNTSTLFNLSKLAGMYFWYKRADRGDKSIIKYFEEYKHCVDYRHKAFNSNYGYYVYGKKLLQLCISRLIEDKNTRQACMCINNNDAMADASIDKLCTNTIQFFIRNNELQMNVQMRSSNFLTLLPYDAFMFCTFMFSAYSRLVETYPCLRIGKVTMQIASLHFYKKTLDAVKLNHGCNALRVNPYDKNWKNDLELKLVKRL